MLKATIVYVTHDQVEAMTLADTIVVMNKGRIEQVGKPLDLYYRPANLFVAGFIGSPAMNFVAGHGGRDRMRAERAVELEDGGRIVSQPGRDEGGRRRHRRRQARAPAARRDGRGAASPARSTWSSAWARPATPIAGSTQARR